MIPKLLQTIQYDALECFHFHGDYLAIGSSDGTGCIRIWDISTGKLVYNTIFFLKCIIIKATIKFYIQIHVVSTPVGHPGRPMEVYVIHISSNAVRFLAAEVNIFSIIEIGLNTTEFESIKVLRRISGRDHHSGFGQRTSDSSNGHEVGGK